MKNSAVNRATSLMLVCVLHVFPAVAQDAAPLLPEISVSATRVERDSFDLPAAIDSIGQRTIREGNPQVNLSEQLGRVPGVVVQNRQNYAQDLQISSRGFGARSGFGVRGLRLIADGIPATMPDGQGQAASFSLSSAQRIEVLRGPFSSLYGNAAGGVIQIFTADGPRIPELSASVLAGSFDTTKLGVQAGGTADSVNYLVDTSRFQTGGYRDHSAARRTHTNAKFKIDAGSRGTVTVVANVLDQPETQDPLGLTAAQVAQNRRQAVASAYTFNTRKSVTQDQVGTIHDLPLSGQDSLQTRLYLGNRQVTQHLGFNGGGALASGGVVDLDRGYGGVGLRWTRETTLAAAPFVFSAGADVDRMAERRSGFLNNNGVTGSLKRDEDNMVENTDFYAQAEWRFAPQWNLLAGLRHSRVQFESRDYFIVAGNLDDSGSVRFARTTPAVGITYRVTPAANVYANWGKGFETPTFAELAYRPPGVGATGLNFALQPADSVHREIGVKLLAGAASRFNASLFRINVSNEIVVNSSDGGRTNFRNAAGTEREGLELLWESRIANSWTVLAAYTRLNARFAQSFVSSGGTVNAGNRLPGVPANTLYGELVWRHAGSGFHAAIEGRRNAKVYTDDRNSEAASGYTVWNVRAGFEQRSGAWRFGEFLRVDNADNRGYIGSVIVAEANRRFYEPAPGRSVMIGAQATLQFR